MLASDEFSAYGASHLTVLVLLFVAGWWLVRYSRSLRGAASADRLSSVFGLTILLTTLPLQIWFLTPGRFDLELSLPIQLSDLAWITAMYALFTRRRWAVALTYYWGLTLSTQAVFTPDLASDFPAPAFILYWAMHALTVVAAIYLTWGIGLAPDWRSYRITVVTTALWAVAVFVFNSVTGTNYGFLNAKPESASILDLFGPWPWYVLVESAIVITVWALITWPWVHRSRSLADRPEQTP